MAPENSKITVRIYGQEYTISASEDKERISRIANYVDEVMRDLSAQGAGAKTGALSMLAAINIAGELLEEREAMAKDAREREQLEKDIAHYQQLWEEAKRTHLQYKEDVRAVQQQKDALQERLNSRAVEFDNMMRSAEERDAKIARLEAELESANSKLQSVSSQRGGDSERIKELQDSIKELEGNYFELQMENIQMKGDLERYRKSQQ